MVDNGSVPTRTWILLRGSLRVPVSQAAVGDGSLANYCKKKLNSLKHLIRTTVAESQLKQQI